MFSTDQSHLRRYLATLGVAVAAGTLSLAGLFFKLQQDLLVTPSTLKTLTPTAKNAILRRQEYLAMGTDILPWFALVGFGGGIALAIYGMIGWSHRQKVIDKREDIGLRNDELQLSQLTKAQQAARVNREARESVVESIVESAVESASEEAINSIAEPEDKARAENGEDRPPQTSVTESEPKARVENGDGHPPQTPVTESADPTSWTREPRASISDVRATIVTLENELIGKLEAVYGPTIVWRGIRVKGAEDVEVDAAVTPEGFNEWAIFELKYAIDIKSAHNRISDGLQHLARAAKGVLKLRRILVLVVPDTVSLNSVQRLKKEAIDRATVFKSPISVYVGRYSDFMSLSAEGFVKVLGLR